MMDRKHSDKTGWYRAWSFIRSSRVVRVAMVVLAVVLALYLIGSLVAGRERLSTVIASISLCLLLTVFVYLTLNPDSLRSQYTKRTLSVASEMLQNMVGGLDEENAKTICELLLPETKATTVIITDEKAVLGSAGELADVFTSGAPIRTPATRYVIEHGIMQSFSEAIDVDNEVGRHVHIPAGIIAPLKVRGRTVGALKFYYRTPWDVNRTQYALATGFAELLSTQLATIELDRQAELTAQAEVRALQAQINPHFLFNTLNTIASFTRTDPERARTLLREFAQFYRATLDNSDSLIPVEREIEQTERYLLFEKARFGDDRIIETATVDEDAEDEQVPAFIIQPLVENSVRHAMPDEGALHIDITVTLEDDSFLIIEVADDGVGMDAETAAHLFDRRRDGSIRADGSNGSSGQGGDGARGGGAGIAMQNISERIRRYFGPLSTTDVKSELGQGTDITLRLDLEGGMLGSR